MLPPVLEAAFLGLVQGVSEFLPVSSSGHLIFISWLFEGKPLPLSVNVALHFGTFLAVLGYFFKDWLTFGQTGLNVLAKKPYDKENFKLFCTLVIASIPAGILGIAFEHKIEDLFHHPMTIVAPLMLVGILLWYADEKSKTSLAMNNMTFRAGFIIGCAQACALIPGVSRSGSTIIAGRFLKFNKNDAAKFSFLLGTPAMGGAALLHYHDFLASLTDPNFYSGVIVSFLSGVIAIRFFMKFTQSHGYLPFTIYRCLLAGCIFAMAY